ncbi:MAG TPA: sigma factor-like helix-turn-helix DNA-binding protein, partial [Myxococcales bacterium]|nr:sigma factor-like helix-turn-helix DNA-binding protein [Myxococcales bacterium]
DELRRRLRMPEDADEEALARAEEQAPADPPDPGVKDAVRAALQALPESQRAVIHLHRYEGMTFAEIARVLGTTPGAVKLRAFRGYETLREQLKGLL